MTTYGGAASDLIHLVSEGVICDTENRGFATPGGRDPLDLLVDASQGFIPLWEQGTVLRWRFQERSFLHSADPEVDKKVITALMAEALGRWGSAAPVRFTRGQDDWDFEVVLRDAPHCSDAGCTLARGFFPDGGRHELLIFPTMFEQDPNEQVETLCHEFGHVFGLRHFFAQVDEKQWPSEKFGTHSPFTIMNYGPQSVLTEADRTDLTELYRLFWSGVLPHINGTPTRGMRPYSAQGAPPSPALAGVVGLAARG